MMLEDDDPSVVFGRLLREARSAAGLSHAELAARIGSVPDYIRRLEAGEENPPLLSMARLAEAVGCRLDIRLAWIVDPDPESLPLPRWRALADTVGHA